VEAAPEPASGSGRSTAAGSGASLLDDGWSVEAVGSGPSDDLDEFVDEGDFELGSGDADWEAAASSGRGQRGAAEAQPVVTFGGRVVAGGTTDFQVRVDPTNLVEGVYRSFVVIQTNDPVRDSLVLPVRVEVGEDPVVTHTIQAEASMGGTITPAGIVTVLDGHPATLSWLGAVHGHRVRARGTRRPDARRPGRLHRGAESLVGGPRRAKGRLHARRRHGRCGPVESRAELRGGDRRRTRR